MSRRGSCNRGQVPINEEQELENFQNDVSSEEHIDIEREKKI